jgi:hypothetical protein
VRLVGCVVVALALALAGCDASEPEGGSGRPDDGGAAEPATRAELISEADAICRRYEKLAPNAAAFERIDHLRTTDLEGYVSEAGELYRRDARNAEAKVDALRRLRPPPEDRPQWREVLAGLEEQADLTRSLSGAGLRGDVDAVRVLFEEAERQAQRLDGLAAGFGLKDC